MNDGNVANDDLSRFVNEIKSIKKKFQDEGKGILLRSFKGFFERYEQAYAIHWTQYTPYFNDGDACTFSVNDLSLKLDPKHVNDDLKDKVEPVGIDEDLDDDANLLESIDIDSRWNRSDPAREGLRKLTLTERAMLDEFSSLNKNVSQLDDVMRELFGDHVRVVVTREGLDVNEHEHD